MADLAETIRSIPLFSGLSREDVAKIMGNFVEVNFVTGTTIFAQGDPGDALYLIQSGAVQVKLDIGGNKTDTLAVLGPQEYFGEMALLSSKARSASVVAVKETSLWRLSREAWDDLIAKHPTWLLHFCAVLSQRLSRLEQQYSQGRAAFNSLAEEFYSRRPAEEQRFYRHAALLNSLDPEIIGSLHQSGKTGAFIAELENSQLPLIRRVENGYEFHLFFRDFLTEKLLDTEGVEKRLQLHSAYVALYEEQRNWEQAIHHSLRATQWDTAIRLIIAHRDELLESSAAFLTNTIARLPPENYNADLTLVQVHADAMCRLDNFAGAIQVYKAALAQHEATLGTATSARYQSVADQMIAKNELPEALNYLRNVLSLVAQQVSAQSGETEADVDRFADASSLDAPEHMSSSRLRLSAWLAKARGEIALARWFGAIFGLAVCAYFWFGTPDIGLTPAATKQLGILLLTLIFWVFNVFPDYGVALIFALGFILSGLGDPNVVLGGFASTTWFTTLGVLGLGAAITSTGLFYRFSLRLVRYFPPKYNWQIVALGIMGIVVMALIPQQSARTAIISKMLINLSESLGYKNPSKASTGLFAASFLGLGQLGFLFLTGSTTSLIAWGLLPMEVRTEFTWGYWFLAALPPTLIVSIIIIGTTMFLFQPESPSKVSYKMVQTQLEILGPLSKYEWITLAVLCLTVGGWLTGTYHKVDGAWISLLAICVLINTGVLGWGMMKKGIDWEMLIYMGATLSIPTLMTQAGIDKWMVGLVSPLILPFVDTPAIAFLVIALITYLVKLVFTSFLTVVTMVIALLPLAADLHVSPWIIIMIVLIASEVWFFRFQIDWHTLAFATTDGKGFSYRLMSRIGPFYAFAYLIALIAAIPYWRFLGLMQ